MTPPERFRIAGTLVPKELTHFPLANAAQFIETMHEVAGEIEKETGKPKGAILGMLEATLGLAEASPWQRGVQSSLDLLKSTKQGDYARQNFVSARTVPQFLREATKDVEKYKATGSLWGAATSPNIKREAPPLSRWYQDAIPDFGFGLPIPSRNQLPLKK